MSSVMLNSELESNPDVRTLDINDLESIIPDRESNLYSRLNGLVPQYERIFGRVVEVISDGKNRIEAIGNHVDYSGGEAESLSYSPKRVKDRNTYEDVGTLGLAARNSDNVIRLYSNNKHDLDTNGAERPYEISLEDFHNRVWYGDGVPNWVKRILAMVETLEEQGEQIDQGFDMLIDANYGIGGGVSSSAALEFAAMQSIDEMYNLGIGTYDLAKPAQVAEHHDAIGANCGPLDQETSARGSDGELVHIKYTGDSENPVVVDTIPYPEELGLVGVTVMDPQDNRSLGKRYNEMAEMIDMALQTLKSISDPGGFETREIDGIAALTLQQFGVFKERFRKASLRRVSDEVSDEQAYVDRIIARVEHVITEVARVREFVAMLQGLDLEDEEQVNQVRARIAELANESGESAIVRHGVATGVPQLPVLLSVLRCSEMRVLGARNHGGGGNKATMLYMGRADALKLRDYLNTYIKNGLSDAKVNEILQMCQENYGLTDMTEEALRTILEEFKERELDIDIVVPGRGSSVLWSGFEHR